MSVELEKPTILLVEDTLTQAMLMQHQLKKAGYSVKLARNAKAALDELGKERYGIILSDINMPGMDGYDLCREVKKNDELKNIPFVLLATPVERAEILRMLDCGADNFILKAYDENTFIWKLDEIVKTKALRNQSGSNSPALFAGKEVSLPAPSTASMDFMLSSFEMYIFQQSKSSPQTAPAEAAPST